MGVLASPCSAVSHPLAAMTAGGCADLELRDSPSWGILGIGAARSGRRTRGPHASPAAPFRLSCGDSRHGAAMVNESDPPGGWLKLETAWQHWGPPDAVRELARVGFHGPFYTGDEPSQREREQNAALAACENWLRGELAAGRLELRVEIGRGIITQQHFIPAEDADRVSISRSGFDLWWDNDDNDEKLLRPRLRQAPPEAARAGDGRAAVAGGRGNQEGPAKLWFLNHLAELRSQHGDEALAVKSKAEWQAIVQRNFPLVTVTAWEERIWPEARDKYPVLGNPGRKKLSP